MKRILILFSSLFLFVLMGIALADVPVVDLTQQSAQSPPADQAPGQTLSQGQPQVQTQEQATAQGAQQYASATAPNTQQQQVVTAAPSDNSDTTAQPQPLSVDQRVARLETQMVNVTQMNLAARLDSLQQSLQQLQGQLELESHNLKVLSEQQRSFYQDVNQRMNQLQNSNVSASTANAPNTAEATQPPTNTSTPADSSANEKQAYQMGFSLLAQKKYTEAVTSFQAYLSSYPKGQYAGNAHYWMAEVYYLQGKIKDAETEFNAVVTNSPKSQKVPDSLLKLALIHVAANKTDQAKQELQQLKQNYPNTTAARLAEKQLRGL